MRLQNVKSEEYESNTSPKIGDLVRLSRDIEEGVDTLYKVTAYYLGRVGNKIRIELADPMPGLNQQEYYYYCLCPQ
jgi:hypothetical protein